VAICQLRAEVCDIFVHVGSTTVTVPTMKHAAVLPWIKRARQNLPPNEARSSTSLMSCHESLTVPCFLFAGSVYLRI